MNSAFKKGDRVSINPKHWNEYADLHPTEVISNLEIEDVLPSTGEFVVRSGHLRFIVDKTEITHRESK